MSKYDAQDLAYLTATPSNDLTLFEDLERGVLVESTGPIKTPEEYEALEWDAARKGPKSKIVAKLQNIRGSISGNLRSLASRRR